MPMKNERIVLCRPCGGLNDMLVQIEKCYRYCKKHKRTLFIDGNISHGGFLDDFSNYFILHDANISFEKINFLTPPFDVFPKCLYNDLYDYEIYRDKKTNLRITKDQSPLTFDFKKDYEEHILVHAQGGGGNTGILAFARLCLKEEIKLHIKTIVDDLKKQSGKKRKYDAIHVRNAGYKTDYKSYFTCIKSKLNKTTVICTDDYECQQYAKMFFGDNIQSVTDIPDLSSCQIKRLEINKYIDRYRTNVDTLTDLFILACADKIYYSPLSGGYYNNVELDPEKEPVMWYVKQGIKSGFLVLAEKLHGNKRIINNMLYRNKFSSLSYYFALYECQLRYDFTKISEKIFRLFSLLFNNGILYTVKYILCKLLKKELPNETFAENPKQ